MCAPSSRRKIVKLNESVAAEKSHGAVLKFNLGTTIGVGGERITFADRQIQRSDFPGGFGILKRVLVEFTGETDITLDQAETDDAGMTRIGLSRRWRKDTRKSERKRKEEQRVVVFMGNLEGARTL